MLAPGELTIEGGCWASSHDQGPPWFWYCEEVTTWVQVRVRAKA